MAGYGGVVEGKVLVGIFTPAFSYPASLSYAATVKAALSDLGLQEDECEFLKQDGGRLACVIKNNKFTLQYVEETYAHNKALIEQLQRAAEALVAFRNKVEEDALLINELKDQISSDNSGWEVRYEEERNMRKMLQDKLEKLKTVVNSDHTTEPSRPKIPKLQLTAMNGTHSEPILTRLSERVHVVNTPPLVIPTLATASIPNTVSPREFRGVDANTQTHPARYISSPRDGQQQGMNMNGKRSISSSNMSGFIASGAPVNPPLSPSSASISNSASTSFSSTTSSQFDALSPHSKHSREPSPRSTQSPRSINTPGSPHAGTGPSSPRTLSSPRGHSSPRSSSLQHSLQHTLQQHNLQHAAHTGSVKEHLRRHSTNFGEDGHVRRHSNADVPPGRSSSPRSKSSSEIPPHYFDLTQPFPDVHSLMPVVHSFSYGSSDSLNSKRRSVASPVPHSRARSETQLDFPPAENLSQCRLCSCDKFRTSKAEWMCTCGHANIKHAVFLKASPAPSPTVSPRKFG